MKRIKKKISIIRMRKIYQIFFFVLSIILIFKFGINNSGLLVPIILIIFITLIFRNGFCGWICPLGTIFDFFREIGKRIGNITFIKPLNKKYKLWVNNNRKILNQVDKYGRYFKYIFLLWMMYAAFIAEGDQHEGLNMILIVAILISLGLFMERPFCKYGCPLGATLGVVSKLSPTKVTRDEDLCIACNLCNKICAFNIDVANLKTVNDKDCNTCLECIDVCPVDGALDLKMNLPVVTKYKSPTINFGLLKIKIKRILISEYIYGFIIVVLFVVGLIVLNLFDL